MALYNGHPSLFLVVLNHRHSAPLTTALPCCRFAKAIGVVNNFIIYLTPNSASLPPLSPIERLSSLVVSFLFLFSLFSYLHSRFCFPFCFHVFRFLSVLFVSPGLIHTSFRLGFLFYLNQYFVFIRRITSPAGNKMRLAG